MIRLRQTIERGMRHRWFGPLFVLLFGLMLALTVLHGFHDSDHIATDLGAFCLGLTIMFSLLIVIRLSWRVEVPLVQMLSGRAPPLAQIGLPSARRAALTVPVPLRL